MQTTVTVFMLVALLTRASTLQWILEAENVPGYHELRNRSDASGTQTALLYTGEALSFQVCFMKETSLSIREVSYSNKGAEVKVTISLDNEVFGSFLTVNNTGNGTFWNGFYHTDTLGVIKTGSGMHRLAVVVADGDDLGVEIDKLVLEADDEHLNAAIYSCKIPCIQEGYAVSNVHTGPVLGGYIIQRSYPTKCAEEDNIYIPVFHNSVSEYAITAKLPMYHSFRNDRSADFTNCSFASDVYWNFTDIGIGELLNSVKLKSQQSILNLKSKNVNANGTVTLQLEVIFPLGGPSKGLTDSQMGSRIFLKLNGVCDQASVALRYKKNDDTYIQTSTLTVSNVSYSHEWTIPDFTWRESNNSVILIITTQDPKGIKIANFYIKRRPVTGDKFFHIYKGDVRVDGVKIDFWWRAHESMNISLSTTDQTWTAHYIQVYVPIPWQSGIWCQVMVLYQDGNVRLLPITPTGVDWIPFGTSVIVGQSDHSFRPSAPITNLHIDPALMTFKVIYRDGGSATMTLFPLIERTELHLSSLNMAQNTDTLPFATFRSMFVEGGIGDSDSVNSNTMGTRHVMGDWGNMTGTTFGVFRRCQSHHLTQSPDLSVSITKA